ncbi:MAG: hypothetical protein JW888_05670 [Pirellulales bacterium]|nr:hypothetical protein [Pirellulales bacterium]
MNKWLPHLAGTMIVLCGLCIVSSTVSAATCTLEPTTLESGRILYRANSPTPDWLFGVTDSQSFYVNFQTRVIVKDGKEERIRSMDGTQLEEFNEVIKKEPAKYNAEIPLRGVAKLGDREYGFVCDSPDPETHSYGLLYFDINGNGDLTDDGVQESDAVRKSREAKEKAEREEAEKAKAVKEKGDEQKASPSKDKKPVVVWNSLRASSYAEFPRTDMKIELDGKKVDYSFFFTVRSQFSSNWGYARASLKSGIYYEGKIDLDGKTRRVVLVDHNSNGRFDDKTEVVANRSSREGPQRIRTNRGDLLYLDPKPASNTRMIWDATGLDFQHHVAKLLFLDGRYYDLKIAPAGNELSLERSEVVVGYVENPNRNYAAVVHGDQGAIKIRGTGGQRVPLPVGQWTLLSYVIDLTTPETADKAKEPDEQTDGKVQEQPDKKKAKVRRRPPAPKYTFASATATTATKPIDVREDQTVALPFGPPYKPVVTPSYYRKDNDTLYLGLTIFGSVEEIVTYMNVEGKLPGKPTFTITDPDGEVVVEDDFAYG